MCDRYCLACNPTELTQGLAGYFSDRCKVDLTRLSVSAHHLQSGEVAIGGYIEDAKDGEIADLYEFVRAL